MFNKTNLYPKIFTSFVFFYEAGQELFKNIKKEWQQLNLSIRLL
jgi:hypothetical protein